MPVVGAGVFLGALGVGVIANELSRTEKHPTGTSSAFGNGLLVGAILGGIAGFLAYRAWRKRAESQPAYRVLTDGPAQFTQRMQTARAARWVGLAGLFVSMWKLRVDEHPLPSAFPWMIFRHLGLVLLDREVPLPGLRALPREGRHRGATMPALRDDVLKRAAVSFLSMGTVGARFALVLAVAAQGCASTDGSSECDGRESMVPVFPLIGKAFLQACG